MITHSWQPGHFFLAGGLRCAWQFEAEQTLPWEIFRGRLLEPRQTRLERRFLAWNLLRVDGSNITDQPLLSVLLDEAENQIHVTRGFLCHAWEPVEANGVIDSQETTRWIRERIGGIILADLPTSAALTDELQCLIWSAVVGTSRLPLHSIEAPHPAFTLGQLAYVARPDLTPYDSARPCQSWRELLSLMSAEFVSPAERAKLLEIVLRGLDETDIAEAVACCLEFGIACSLPGLVRRMFNDVSLSPWTTFIDRTLAFLQEAARQGLLGAVAEIDLLGFLLRHLCRHLTAYDLILFHYRGANYPDALLLDAVLTRFLVLVVESQEYLYGSDPKARVRRRALLHGCLMRRQYEGHAVPDQPTSPGENARVMPNAFVRVPDEQIEQPSRRSKLLFADRPLAGQMTPNLRYLLTRACLDLVEEAEIQELGMALFIDRPLGFFKAPAEADATPLLSYEAFSRNIATQRLDKCYRLAEELGLDIAPEHWEACRYNLSRKEGVKGLPLECVPDSIRPAVALADARKVADDFVILRTTRQSLARFWEAATSVGLPRHDEVRLLVRLRQDNGKTRLVSFDGDFRVVLEFDVEVSSGYQTRAGVELPRAGFVNHTK